MTREFSPIVYLMASRRNGTLYVGVTANLLKRVAQHRQGTLGGFSDEYAIKMQVWFEPHQEMALAILREKRIKKWRRVQKLQLIETTDPDWHDLATDYGFDPLDLDSRIRGNDL